MKQKTPKDHSTYTEEECSVFPKKSYPSVKLGKHNNASATQSFGSALESLEERGDSSKSTIDFQIFPEQPSAWTDDLNKGAETSCFSGDPDSNNLNSDISELITLEDAQIVEGKHEKNENTAGVSFTLMRKSSLQKDNSTSYPGNGSGAPRENKSKNEGNLEVQTDENTGDLSSKSQSRKESLESFKKDRRKGSRRTANAALQRDESFLGITPLSHAFIIFRFIMLNSSGCGRRKT